MASTTATLAHYVIPIDTLPPNVQKLLKKIQGLLRTSSKMLTTLHKQEESLEKESSEKMQLQNNALLVSSLERDIEGENPTMDSIGEANFPDALQIAAQNNNQHPQTQNLSLLSSGGASSTSSSTGSSSSTATSSSTTDNSASTKTVFLKYNDGSMYKGELEDNTMREGLGSYFYPSGTIYVC